MSKIKHIDGVELSSASSNTRYKNRDDVVVIKLKKGSKISAKFTNNSFLGAPVVVAKKHLQKKKNNETILLINAGNANAGNGKSGEKASTLCCKEISEINFSNNQLNILNKYESQQLFKTILNKLQTESNCSGEMFKDISIEAGKECNLKGKDLFYPLRIAIYGSSDGPDIPIIYSILEKNEIIARLSKAIND